jgi:FkbM family methyltransferase
MKTCLDDILIGWTDFHDNQLLRCKKLKEYEAKLLLNIPKNSSFLDIGAHFGDSVLTMAMYAKNNNRNDIRFFAFEPNKTKCKHITKISKLNNLNINIFNTCVGNINSNARPDKISRLNVGHCNYIIDKKGKFEIMKLDNIKEMIKPVGIMHIDTEGWEKMVLQGASAVINEPNNKMYIIAESFHCYPCVNIWKKDEKSDDEIINEIKKYNYIRLEDIHDEETNLVFKINF